EPRRRPDVRRVCLALADPTAADEVVDVGSSREDEHLRAVRLDVLDLRDVQLVRVPHQDLRAELVGCDDRDERQLLRELDLLVAGRVGDVDARVLVDLRDRLLEAGERAAGANLELDTRALDRAGVVTLLRVGRAVRPGELVDEPVLGLGEPVGLDDDLRATRLPQRAHRALAALRGNGGADADRERDHERDSDPHCEGSSLVSCHPHSFPRAFAARALPGWVLMACVVVRALCNRHSSRQFLVNWWPTKPITQNETIPSPQQNTSALMSRSVCRYAR